LAGLARSALRAGVTTFRTVRFRPQRLADPETICEGFRALALVADTNHASSATAARIAHLGVRRVVRVFSARVLKIVLADILLAGLARVGGFLDAIE
jgi:hypothetical protein